VRPHARVLLWYQTVVYHQDLYWFIKVKRVKSGIAAAKARGKKIGRQPGQRIKSDRLAPKVVILVQDGVSYRKIASKLNISKTTVTEIMKRQPNLKKLPKAKEKIG
jgi:DNA invertase Pin-like site-specific DNA recombinase